MEPEGLEVSEVCFHKKIAENRTIQSIHRTENILLNLISIYGQNCSFKSQERARDSVNESRKFFLDWESSQSRPSQKLREVRASQRDAQNYHESNGLLIEDTPNSNVAPVNAIKEPVVMFEIPREYGNGVHVTAHVQRGESMSDFDCDLSREIERVKRKRNCADFNSQKFSRFHANLIGAQTSTQAPLVKRSNATTSEVTLSQEVFNKSATQAKQRSAMSIKEKLMNDSGKIFIIPKRDIKPSANRAKLNDWLARNKKQPMKRKLSEDESESRTHINSKSVKMTLSQSATEQSSVQLKPRLSTPLNSKYVAKKSLIPRPTHSATQRNKKQPIKRKLSEDESESGTHIHRKRVKMTQSDTEQSFVQLKSRLSTPLNSKYVAKKSLIPRPTHSVKPNPNKQSYVIASKYSDVGNVPMSHSRYRKYFSASRTEAKIHKSLIPILIKPVNKQTPDNRIVNTNIKSTLLNKKTTVTSHASTHSVTHVSYNCIKPMHTHDTVEPTSNKNIQTASSRAKIVKPTPYKNSKH